MSKIEIKWPLKNTSTTYKNSPLLESFETSDRNDNSRWSMFQRKNYTELLFDLEMTSKNWHGRKKRNRFL